MLRPLLCRCEGFFAAAFFLLCCLLPAQAQTSGTSPTADEPRFDILEFVVRGDTLLGAATIERVVYGFLGPGKTVADAENARKALERAYQDAGYLSVSVLLPPQQVGAEGGEVLLQVVAAPVDRLRVTGSQYNLPSQIRAAVPSLQPGTVPNFNEMQEELRTLSRTGVDRDITPILAAGQRPATLDVELKVQDQLPVHGAIEANNKQALDTQAGRLEASISVDNLFQRAHSLGLYWIVSPRRTSESNIQILSYQLPLGGVGDRLSLQFTNSDSNTATAVGDSTVSRGQSLRLRWRDALRARTGINHGLSWGLAWRDLRDRSLAADGVASDLPSLRYSTVQLGYDLQLESSLPRRSSAMQVELTAGLPGVNRRDVECFGRLREQFACKRDQAGPGFQVFALNVQHREPLGAWNLLLRLQAQASDSPLVSAEQLVVGGQDSVRGYFEGEQAADLGAVLRMELSTPGWAAWEGASLNAVAFSDIAGLRRLYVSAEEVATTGLASAGLGLRASSGSGLQFSLTWARVLKDSARLVNGEQRPVSGALANRQQRWDLSLRHAF